VKIRENQRTHESAAHPKKFQQLKLFGITHFVILSVFPADVKPAATKSAFAMRQMPRLLLPFIKKTLTV
jgi:hypothetical protein